MFYRETLRQANSMLHASHLVFEVVQATKQIVKQGVYVRKSAFPLRILNLKPGISIRVEIARSLYR